MTTVTLEEAIAKIDQLTVALEFYANHDNWYTIVNYGEKLTAQRYLGAPDENPYGAGGWYAAEQALYLKSQGEERKLPWKSGRFCECCGCILAFSPPPICRSCLKEQEQQHECR